MFHLVSWKSCDSPSAYLLWTSPVSGLYNPPGIQEHSILQTASIQSIYTRICPLRFPPESPDTSHLSGSFILVERSTPDLTGDLVQSSSNGWAGEIGQADCYYHKCCYAEEFDGGQETCMAVSTTSSSDKSQPFVIKHWRVAGCAWGLSALVNMICKSSRTCFCYLQLRYILDTPSRCAIMASDQRSRCAISAAFSGDQYSCRAIPPTQIIRCTCRAIPNRNGIRRDASKTILRPAGQFINHRQRVQNETSI